MYDNWEDLEKSILECKKCRLCTNRTNIVFGQGNKKARLMFIGEGPGADEDKQGIPFVGKAGQLMNNAFQALEINREDVYIKEKIVSKTKNTPWINKKLKGQVRYTIVSGRIVYSRV